MFKELQIDTTRIQVKVAEGIESEISLGMSPEKNCIAMLHFFFT